MGHKQPHTESMVKIFCKNTGTYKEFQEGTMLLDMINEFDFEKPYEIIAAG